MMNWVLVMLEMVNAKVKTDRMRMASVRKTPQHVVLPERSSRLTLTEKGSRPERNPPICEQNLLRHFFSRGA